MLVTICPDMVSGHTYLLGTPVVALHRAVLRLLAVLPRQVDVHGPLPIVVDLDVIDEIIPAAGRRRELLLFHRTGRLGFVGGPGLDFIGGPMVILARPLRTASLGWGWSRRLALMAGKLPAASDAGPVLLEDVCLIPVATCRRQCSLIQGRKCRLAAV